MDKDPDKDYIKFCINALKRKYKKLKYIFQLKIAMIYVVTDRKKSTTEMAACGRVFGAASSRVGSSCLFKRVSGRFKEVPMPCNINQCIFCMLNCFKCMYKDLERLEYVNHFH